MKKSLLALAALGIIGSSAQAQTSLTIYGVVDAGFVYEDGNPAGSVSKLQSGVQSGSRLGFRGTEDLGGGLSARFVLETGIAIDTGGFNQGNLAFARQAHVGLGGGWGAVTLGRQYTPHYTTLLAVDPFQAGLAGSAQNLILSPTRMNNTIRYITPAWSGFIADFAYGFGEVLDNSTGNQTWGAALGYTYGPFLFKLAHHRQENITNTDHSRTSLAAFTWDFTVAKAYLGYNESRAFGGTESRDFLVGVTAPFGPSTFIASYIKKDDRSGLGNDADQWALGLTYAISKRTNFYVAYGDIGNDNAANFTVNTATDTGTGDSAFNLGVRHAF